MAGDEVEHGEKKAVPDEERMVNMVLASGWHVQSANELNIAVLSKCLSLKVYIGHCS